MSMSPIQLLFIIAPLVAGLLLFLNYLLSLSKPSVAKISPFECGFSSFSQTRSPFHIHFFLVALLFLIFDLEIALLYPYLTSSLQNQGYGLIFIFLFLVILSIGFIYEIGKNALKLRS
jgi:NADH-ubiquinone oxidoreductase chain 3